VSIWAGNFLRVLKEVTLIGHTASEVLSEAAFSAVGDCAHDTGLKRIDHFERVSSRTRDTGNSVSVVVETYDLNLRSHCLHESNVIVISDVLIVRRNKDRRHPPVDRTEVCQLPDDCFNELSPSLILRLLTGK